MALGWSSWVFSLQGCPTLSLDNRRTEVGCAHSSCRMVLYGLFSTLTYNVFSLCLSGRCLIQTKILCQRQLNPKHQIWHTSILYFTDLITFFSVCLGESYGTWHSNTSCQKPFRTTIFFWSIFIYLVTFKYFPNTSMFWGLITCLWPTGIYGSLASQCFSLPAWLRIVKFPFSHLVVFRQHSSWYLV